MRIRSPRSSADPPDPRGTGRSGPIPQTAAPTVVTSPFATTRQWRQIVLERQLPRFRRLTGGVALPTAVCTLALLALTGLCALYLHWPQSGRVPQTLLTAQRDTARSTAQSISAGRNRAVRALRPALAAYAADPQHDQGTLLATALKAVGGRGAVLLHPTDHTVIAASGEPINPALAGVVPADVSSRAILGPQDRPELLLITVLPDGSWLLLTAPLAVPQIRLAPSAHESVLLAPHHGGVAASQGSAPADAAVLSLLRTAQRRSDGDGTVVSGTVSHRSAPGAPAGTAPVVAAAAIPGMAADLVLVARLPIQRDATSRPGLPAAVVLLVLAAGIALLIRVALVRPLRRLLGQAKEIACGERPTGRLGSGTTEVHRIAVALRRRVSDGSRDTTRRSRRPRVSALVTVLIATMALVGWSAFAAVGIARADRNIPAVLTADAANQATALADAVRESFDASAAELADLGTRLGAGTGDLDREIDRFAKDHDTQYRSVYLATSDGRPSHTGGHSPRRSRLTPGTGTGVWLDQKTGTVPVLYAQTALPDGRALIGEYNIDHLITVLGRVPGRAHLVDDQLRLILDTDGYLAFAPLTGSAIRDAARRARGAAAVAGVFGVRGIPTEVAAAALPGSQPAGWTVVTERSVLDIQTPANQLLRQAWLVAALGLTIALLFAGWHYFVVIQPLRALARAAEDYAEGDLDTVIAPVRQDEVGALAMCLDVCRQTDLHGDERLAGAPRIRGTGGTHTLVLPRLSAQRHRARSGGADPNGRPGQGRRTRS